MHTPSGVQFHAIVFNGEIYNHSELRPALQGAGSNSSEIISFHIFRFFVYWLHCMHIYVEDLCLCCLHTVSLLCRLAIRIKVRYRNPARGIYGRIRMGCRCRP